MRRYFLFASALLTAGFISAQAPNPFVVGDTAFAFGSASSSEVLAGDMDNDGDDDLLLLGVVDGGNATVMYLRNDYPAGFAPPLAVAALPGRFRTTGGTLVDVDGNATLDLLFGDGVSVSGAQDHLYLLRNLGAGVFGSVERITQNAPLHNVHSSAAGDLDGDGLPEAAVFADDALALFAHAGGAFDGGRLDMPTVRTTQATLADLNGDGLAEVVVAALQSLMVYWNAGSGNLHTQADTLVAAPNPFNTIAISAFAVGDLDRDGDADLAFSSDITLFNDGLFWAANDGHGAFGAPQYLGALGHYRPENLALADWNGDGFLDIASTPVGADQVRVAFSLGQGSFAPLSTVYASGSPEWVVPANINGDAVMDVALHAAAATEQVLTLINSGACATGAVPGALDHRFASGELQLQWRATPYAQACMVQAKTLDGSLSGKRVVLVPDQASATLPLAAFPAGSHWTWRTACACSISPLERTAWSGYEDTFHIPAARAMQTGPVEATPVALQISPNPASTSLRVSFEGTRVGNEALVLDLQGRIQHVFALPGESDTLNGVVNLDVSSWPEGQYFLQTPNGHSEVFQVIH